MERHTFWRLYAAGLLLVVLLLLAACTDDDSPATAINDTASINDLTFPNPDDTPGVVEVRRFAVEWRIVSREHEHAIQCGSATGQSGCTYFVPGADTCTVFAVDPLDYPYGAENEQALATFGHEMMHCVHWAFHKRGTQQ